jgi:hypothetical protein
MLAFMHRILVASRRHRFFQRRYATDIRFIAQASVLSAQESMLQCVDASTTYIASKHPCITGILSMRASRCTHAPMPGIDTNHTSAHA